MIDVLICIKNQYNDLSKSHKMVADFILENYESAIYMTAGKIGQTLNISESTVVRFASEVGFDGYPKFQKELLATARLKMNSVDRIKATTKKVEYSSMLSDVLESDISHIRTTFNEIDHDVFEQVVDELINANKIYILGVRSCFALANFIGFYFSLIFDNVKVIEKASSTEILEQIIHAKTDDVILGISFPRYSRRTINAMKYAKENGIKVIALTDCLSSPLGENADLTLVAKSDMAGIADSLVAPLSVINALIACISRKKAKETEKTLGNLEKIWEKHRVYSEDL